MITRGVYVPWIQSRVVQAQYFRDPKQMDRYLSGNIFLPDLNGEDGKSKKEYKTRLLSLESIVMVAFENDTMITPKETAWFTTLDSKGGLVKLQDQEIYKQVKMHLRL